MKDVTLAFRFPQRMPILMRNNWELNFGLLLLPPSHHPCCERAAKECFFFSFERCFLTTSSVRFLEGTHCTPAPPCPALVKSRILISGVFSFAALLNYVLSSCSSVSSICCWLGAARSALWTECCLFWHFPCILNFWNFFSRPINRTLGCSYYFFYAYLMKYCNSFFFFFSLYLERALKGPKCNPQ